MADQEQRDDLTMEGYFNEGLADGAEPNNPFEVLEPEQPRKKRSNTKKRRGLRNVRTRRILIAAGAAAILIIALIIAIIVRLRKNDGARYALKLSQNIGQPVSSAAKNAGVSLADSSRFSTLNKLYASYQGMTESGKTCQIQGVKLPEWAIFMRCWKRMSSAPCANPTSTRISSMSALRLTACRNSSTSSPTASSISRARQSCANTATAMRTAIPTRSSPMSSRLSGTKTAH